jgi:hypothetical protein
MDYICFDDAHPMLDITTLLEREVSVSAQEKGLKLLNYAKRRVV